MDEVINYFKELSKIPRETKNEKAISDWICELARSNGLDVKQDDMWNIIVHKSASSGYEYRDKIIFQSHLDMVCEKEIGTNHDFNKDGIEIIEYIDNGKKFLKAKGTTLGADDGIGVAIMIMLMLDNKIKMPETYYIFTTQEEVGMYGAKAIDISNIDAKYLINLDSEDEEEATVGCAGGMNLIFSKKEIQTISSNQGYKLEITGLKGGHSGVEIDKGRINSNYLAAKILSDLGNMQISSMIGGTKDNVICYNTKVVFTGDMNKEVIDMKVQQIIDNIKITDEDKGLNISIKEINENVAVYSNDVSKSIIDLLLKIKQNVIDMSDKMTGFVESSGNIGIVSINENEIIIKESIRSSVEEKKRFYATCNEKIAESLGFKYEEEGDYPGWDINTNSKLQKVYLESYKKIHNGKEPKVLSIHAGLECGVFAEKKPNLDMISIGPNMYDVHTPNERLDVESVEKLSIILSEMIKKL